MRMYWEKRGGTRGREGKGDESKVMEGNTRMWGAEKEHYKEQDGVHTTGGKSALIHCIVRSKASCLLRFALSTFSLVRSFLVILFSAARFFASSSFVNFFRSE